MSDSSHPLLATRNGPFMITNTYLIQQPAFHHEFNQAECDVHGEGVIGREDRERAAVEVFFRQPTERLQY